MTTTSRNLYNSIAHLPLDNHTQPIIHSHAELVLYFGYNIARSKQASPDLVQYLEDTAANHQTAVQDLYNAVLVEPTHDVRAGPIEGDIHDKSPFQPRHIANAVHQTRTGGANPVPLGRSHTGDEQGEEEVEKEDIINGGVKSESNNQAELGEEAHGESNNESPPSHPTVVTQAAPNMENPQQTEPPPTPAATAYAYGGSFLSRSIRSFFLSDGSNDVSSSANATSSRALKNAEIPALGRKASIAGSSFAYCQSEASLILHQPRCKGQKHLVATPKSDDRARVHSGCRRNEQQE